ncbi:hypothetical protein KHC28_00430 [Ancylobacter sonchi]|uniref:hypothetical protein n=1 Tax=Ancylobacter sonchi TaxID=1937790 RepID=UPI001BD457DF|nr:hypothetical protein [Ancylobacter sonchi]MBS7532131.1 hypothetical protein [Ancylobacter sonchi]
MNQVDGFTMQYPTEANARATLQVTLVLSPEFLALSQELQGNGPAIPADLSDEWIAEAFARSDLGLDRRKR